MSLDNMHYWHGHVGAHVRLGMKYFDVVKHTEAAASRQMTHCFSCRSHMQSHKEQIIPMLNDGYINSLCSMCTVHILSDDPLTQLCCATFARHNMVRNLWSWDVLHQPIATIHSPE